MKKYIQNLLLITLAILSFEAGAQKRTNENQMKELGKVADALSDIYLLKEVYHTIYHRSVSWVYVQSDWDNKRELSAYIDEKYEYIKKSIKVNSLSNFEESERTKFSLIFRKIDEAIASASVIRNSLCNYEDYENKQLLVGAQVRLTEVMTPLYYEIDATANSLLETHEQRFQVLIKKWRGSIERGKGKSSSDKLTDLKFIEANYSRLSAFYKAWELNKRIHVGVMNWLNRAEDVKSKRLLYSSFDEFYAVKKFLLKEREQTTLLSEQRSLDTLIMDYTSLVQESYNTARNLQTPEQYEDPLTKLLAEDALESRIIPNFEALDIDLISASTKRVKLFKNSILVGRAKKLSDIRSVLSYYYIDLKDFVNSEFDKLKNKGLADKYDQKELMESLVPLYDEYFSQEEIETILRFQRSKVGRKLKKKSAFLETETHHAVSKYFKSLEE